MKEIARGAEAVIYQHKDTIIKHRLPKKYRIKQIDDSLRKSRTRREAKVMEQMPVPSPKIISFDDKDMKIVMELIDGVRLRDSFKVAYCIIIGRQLAEMHNKNIIHGDLTTSNMILKNDMVYFIDFGLSFFSTKIEDRAVDLHLLKEALKSKHYKYYEKAFEEVVKGYKKTSNNAIEVLSRLEEVEDRGRNKGKG